MMNKFHKIQKLMQIQPKYELGGIIAGGVAHADKNEIGDYGIPVVNESLHVKNGGRYNNQHKEAEVESEEIVFNLETSKEIEKLVDEYNSCGCYKKLVKLGKLVREAFRNMSDETCRISCEFKPKLQQI